MKKSGDETLRKEFQILKALVQKRLRRAFWGYTEQVICNDNENITNNKSTTNKKFWSFINTRRTEKNGISPLKKAGKLVSEPVEQAEILNEQFHSVFTPCTDISWEEFRKRCPSPTGGVR